MEQKEELPVVHGVMRARAHDEKACQYCLTGSEHQEMNPQDSWTTRCLASHDDMKSPAMCELSKDHEGLHYSLIQTVDKVWWR